MDRVPITDRTRLLSDNGPGYVSRAYRDYMGMVGIRHILATPFHPQTNGKLERYHQTLKRDVNQTPYELPSDLEAAIVAFVSYYNYRRYHKALWNVTLSDVLRGRRQEILRRRNEVKAQTIERRRQHNRALRECWQPAKVAHFETRDLCAPVLRHVNHLTERTGFVKTVLPLLALWLPECHSAAQIQGQDRLSAVRPCTVESRARDAVAGIYESRSSSVKTPST